MHISAFLKYADALGHHGNHVGLRVLPDEEIPKHLHQFALSTWGMSLVLSWGPDALLHSQGLLLISVP